MRKFLSMMSIIMCLIFVSQFVNVSKVSAATENNLKQYPLCDIGVYKFLENLNYLSLYSDKYTQYRDSYIYAFVIPEKPLIQEGKENVYLYVSPTTGKIFQVSLFFERSFSTESAILLTSKIMNALEGNLYDSDRTKAEQKLSGLFYSSQYEPEAYYYSNAMKRMYGFKKYDKVKVVELRIKSRP